MPAKNFFSYVIFLSVSGLGLSACPSSCSKATSKSEYIPMLDARCTKLYERVQTAAREKLRKPKDLAALFEYEKHLTELRDETEVLRILPRPKEDESLLDQYWETVDKVWDLRMGKIEKLREQMERTDKMKSGTGPEIEKEMADSLEAHQAFERATIEMESLIKIERDIAKKYGFKVCD